MNPFLRGIELMVRGCDGAVIVPVAFDNLWGSIFSRSGGRFFTKWPRGLRRTVRIAFGPPLKTPVSAFAVRQAVRVALVQARALAKEPVPLPETYDLNWPHWQHPTLGLLTASAKDSDHPRARGRADREQARHRRPSDPRRLSARRGRERRGTSSRNAWPLGSPATGSRRLARDRPSWHHGFGWVRAP